MPVSHHYVFNFRDGEVVDPPSSHATSKHRAICPGCKKTLTETQFESHTCMGGYKVPKISAETYRKNYNWTPRRGDPVPLQLVEYSRTIPSKDALLDFIKNVNINSDDTDDV